MSRWNHAERIGLVTTAIAAVIILFLHNPIDGYRVQRVVDHSVVVSKNCSEDKTKEYYALVQLPRDNSPQAIERGFRINQLANECFELSHQYEEEVLPFSEWSSTNPIVAWLGSIAHLLGTLAALGAI